MGKVLKFPSPLELRVKNTLPLIDDYAIKAMGELLPRDFIFNYYRFEGGVLTIDKTFLSLVLTECKKRDIVLEPERYK